MPSMPSVRRGRVSTGCLILVLMLAACSHTTSVSGMGMHEDKRLTKMEMLGIIGEWCEPAPWMVSFMKRMIACRVEFLKANPDMEKKQMECAGGEVGKLGIDASVVDFKPEKLNTEEGEREMTCALLKKDPQALVKAIHMSFHCMDASEEQKKAYNDSVGPCMAAKAKAEEEAWDKEQADKKTA